MTLLHLGRFMVGIHSELLPILRQLRRLLQGIVDARFGC